MGGFHYYVTLSSFILLVALVATGRVERAYVSLIIILIMLLTGTASPIDLYTLDYDVLGLILGMCIFAVFMEESGFAGWFARSIISRTKSEFQICFLLVLGAGLTSLFVENVSVTLVFAPIMFKVIEFLKINPVPLALGLAAAANMSGSALMTGDPPAMIVAGAYNLDFTEFIIYKGRPSMFFITLIPMIVATYIHSTIYHRGRRIIDVEPIVINVDKSFILEVLSFLTLKITLLSLKKYLHLSLTSIALISVGGLILTRLLIHRDRVSVINALKKGFEWKLLVFLIGVFLLSKMFEKHGIASSIAKGIVNVVGLNKLLVLNTIYIISLALSAFLDNVPITVTFIPIVNDLAKGVGFDPVVGMWAALSGVTAGGNFTYIGATANLVMVRLLEKRGENVSFIKYFKTLLFFNITNALLVLTLLIVFQTT